MLKKDTFISFFRPSIGEEEIKEVEDSLRSGWLTMGPKTKRFEKMLQEYTGCKHAIVVNSCTSALHLALIVLGISEGDEVITSPLTFAATANIICQVGAKPVFADISEDTFNIDPKKVEQAITSKTKAIVLVHYAGQPAKINELKKIADKHGLFLVEDAAHALGAEYNGKKIGSNGNLTCFSFYANKNMTTGEGGAILTEEDKLAERLKKLRLHGISKDAWKRYSKDSNWFYEVEELGYKYNSSDINSSLGIHQLKRLDSFIVQRKKIAEYYEANLKDLKKIKLIKWIEGKSAYHLYPIILNGYNRSKFIKEMKEKGIGTGVHFFPLHLNKYYKENFSYKKGDFPIAERIGGNEVSIPLYPGLNEQELKHIVNSIKEILNDEN